MVNPLPLRTGLLLSRVCVYIQLLLVASLVAKLIVALIPDPLGTILEIIPYMVVLNVFYQIRIKVFDFDREMMRPKNSTKPDYWQYEWTRKSRFDVRTPKAAWRVVHSTAILAVFTGFFLTYASIYLRSHYPGTGMSINQNLEVWTYVTFLLGPFVGNTFPFARKPYLEVSYRPDPDDNMEGDCPSGVGSRVRPPSPVLTARNHFPNDARRHG
jgi:hypothetical protein